METEIETSPRNEALSVQDYLVLNSERILDLANVKKPELRAIVYDILTDHHNTYDIDDYAHRYPIEMVAKHESDFLAREHNLPDEIYGQFTKLIRDANENSERVFQARVAQGIVEMDHIPRLFKVGQKIQLHEGEVMGGILKEIEVIRSMFSTYIEVKMNVIHGLDGKPKPGIHIARFRGFSGTRDIDTLPIRALSDDTKAVLTERGLRMLSYMKPGTYVSFQGSIVQDSWYGSHEARADGRVVIDSLSFRRIDPNQWRSTRSASGIDEDEGDNDPGLDGVEDEEAWMCHPHLYGFSMVAKRWGRMSVAGMSDIQWREDAFARVVMPERQKNMVHALVKNHGKSIDDIIDGKGGGCIFLLHGEPGGGKTLLSESVAEVLKRPLYSVSIGELGTDPKQLEVSLRAILDVATVWNSVILLDEADIFLEERDHKDIARNAMVGVFLRLLEYHNGVMFMTTNRVKNIDRAFYSRISVAIRFEVADTEKRMKIWENLLEYAKLDVNWAARLSEFNINGRQIKNCIRLAQTLALSEDRAAVIDDLIEAISQSLSFEQSMIEERDEEGVSK